MLTAIAARARDGAIGKSNTIPWDVPEDLAFFQRETHGGAIIMGRNTWESLPFKPLKNRLNLVVSSRMPSGDTVVASLANAIAEAERQGYRRIYAIGGEGIYREALGIADRLLITEVETEVQDADAFFPSFEPDAWRLSGTMLLRKTGPRAEVHEFLRKG